jgi:hypothetical protein
MNRHHVSLLHRFLSSVLILLVTTQCVAAPATLNAPTSSTSNNIGGPASTVASSQTGEPTVEESGEPVTVDLSNLPTLGSTTFTVDSSIKAQGEYLADGTDLRLQLTDTAGYTWTLVIPDMALSTPEKISMTSLKDITSQELDGNLVSGVQLEPDGLQFILPARLSVSGPASQDNMILLGSNQDGSQVSFLIPDTEAEGTTALIYHFSSTISDDLGGVQLPFELEYAQEIYNAMVQLGKQILKTPISTPTPPSVKLRCLTKEEKVKAAEQWKKFMQEFNNPEMMVARALIAAQRTLSFRGEGSGYVDTTLILPLVQRQITKVKNLIATYGNQSEYLLAINSVVISSLSDKNFLGGGDNAELTKLFQQLANMWNKAIDDLIKELVEQHEYRNVPAILIAARAVHDLGGQDMDLEKILEKIRKAMHFDLELKSTLTVASVHHWILEANFPVQIKSDIEVTKLSGDGTGNLSSYVYDGAPEYSATAQAFSVNAQFNNFYPCDGTAKFSVDQFFPASETVTVADPEDPRTFSQNITQLGWETHFGDRLVDGRYTFEVTINNNSENAVDQSFTQVFGPNETIFEVKLIHTPQQ